MTRYLIGIDLGTTNSALSYIDLRQTRNSGLPRIQTFPVPQLTGPAEVVPRPLLPSFLYLPGEHDLPPASVALPWDPDITYAVGEFARNHGARVPGRLVTSAKSWLCHSGVDRTAPLLPWSAPPEVQRISPLEASARYLRHLRDAWNYVHSRGADDARLEKQNIVLTVPASFDDVARNLTLEAAQAAGFQHVTLLEEPQAAFYCWLATHSPQEAAALRPGWYCLVVDVGGGTSDFSLIQAAEEQGELTFVRQAVGDHLLLGGDNMDLALAKYVEAKLPGVGRLDAVQYGMLTQACRQAKEALLGPNPPAQFAVTVMGRGRKVIGGTFHADLTPAEVRQVILDGFFPVVPRDAEPQRGTRVGLHEMGLPYVSDPSVTRHLAQFLREHPAQTQAVLFNGGVFQPEILRQRVIDVLAGWYGTGAQSWQPFVLSNESLDLAVSVGAAHYAWLRHTGGKRIGGGIPRSYYLGIAIGEGAPSVNERESEARSVDEGCERDGRKQTVLCVVPQHLEEGKEIALPKPELELALGQPVAFPLFTSTVRAEDQAGDVLEIRPAQLWQLPPLHTILRGGKRSGVRKVPVTLAARCTEIGTVELYCVANEGGNRWRLEFNVRDVVKGAPAAQEEVTGDDGEVGGLVDVWPEEQVQAAARLIRATFSDSVDAVKPQELTKALEAALDAPRHKWPTGLCRRLWEFLAEVADERRRSQAHLNRWYNLAGYCLRPGFGDPVDRFRIEQLWKILHAPPKKDASGKGGLRLPEGGADYWIMWRRVAGGLNVSLQSTLFNRLRPVLLPSRSKGAPKPPANELTEMWRAAAGLERLDVKVKEALGQNLIKSVRRSPAPPYAFYAVTRLGARRLIYGPLNAVVHPQVVEGWLDQLVSFQPGHEGEKSSWGFCLVQLARRTGQRALDVDDSHRQSILTVLRGLPAPRRWLRLVEEVTELESEEESQMFGESLPIGLRLVRTEED
jgi:molecular chaperone DnaK (HSP70)